jgi:transcriptional regulator with XRE-family HTH domain
MELTWLADIIKKNRKLKKYTQASLAEYSSTSINTIKKVESGFLDEVGIKKVESVLDILELELCVRPKGRPLTLDELNEKS